LYENWYDLDWFGLYYDGGEGWIWHEKRKWIFLVDDSWGGAYSWVENKKEWLWFSKFKHPYYYNYTQKKWYIERKPWYEYGKSKYK